MSKRKEIALQEIIESQEGWEEIMGLEKLYVVDAHSSWCGSCTSIVDVLRRLRNELGDDLLRFACADVDKIDSLQKYRGKCEPNFLIYGCGNLIASVRGCNAPLLQTTVVSSLENEHKVLEGKSERVTIEGNVKGSEPDIDSDESESESDGDDIQQETLKKQLTIAVIKPDVVANEQTIEVIKKIQEADIEIVDEMEIVLTEDEAKELYQDKSEEPYFDDLIKYMTSGPCRVLALTKGETGQGVVELWREIIGPFDAAVAKENNPNSLRALYGTDAAMNGIHGSSSTEEAMRELAFFFPDVDIPTYQSKTHISRPISGRLRRQAKKRLQRTLAIIRPDALRLHKDEILKKINEMGMVIAMQKEIELNESQVEAFYRDHVDQPYFPQLVKQMTCGPILALCLAHDDAVSQWKSVLGPKGVDEIPNEPDSLRAQFHVENAEMNMLHGSDSPANAENELRAFFEMDQTLAVIKPEAYEQQELVIKKLEEAGFMVSHRKSMNLTEDIVSELYKNKHDSDFYQDLISQMTKGPSLMVVLSAEDSIKKLRKHLGPVDPKLARRKQRSTLRAHFGYDILRNGVHAVSNEKEARENIELFFGDAKFDWDGYFMLPPSSKKSPPKELPTPIPRLRDLAPPLESESENESYEDLDEEIEDEGPLALLQKPVEVEDGLETIDENDDDKEEKPKENLNDTVNEEP